MTHLTRAALLIAALAAAGCTNGNRFDNDASAGAGLNAGGGVDSGIIPGGANDPASQAYFQQTVGDRVFFQVDQSTLTPEARATLDGQAAWLQTNSDYLAVIEGHADEQGTREYNIALGARRANAVRDYLISRGIDAGRLRFVSYGKERPVEVCSEESCYAKNRRSVTVLAAGLTG